MRARCPRETLLEALQHVRSATTVRTTLPILSHVLVKGEKGKLVFYSTDLDVGILWEIEADVEKEGMLSVPARRFLEWVSHLDEADVSLSVLDNYVLLLQSGKAKVKLNGLDPKEFPSVPAVGQGEELKLPVELLQEGISRVSFAAASSSEPRVILTGVLFEADGGSLRFVATNAHRLALWEREGESHLFHVIVPARSMQEVLKVARKGEEVTVFIQSHLVVFSQPGRTLFARPMEGKFPPYKQVLPESFEIEWGVSLKEFQSALKRVAVVAKEDAGGVRFTGKEGCVLVSVVTQDVGEAEESVVIEEGKGEGDIVFNVDYVLDVLPHLRGERVWLQLNGSDKPAVVHGEDQGYLYVIMPMRLS